MAKRGKTFNQALHRGVLTLFLFGMGIFLLWLSSNDTGFAEWYSRYIYPLWVNTFGRLFSIFSFSMSEFLIYFMCVSAVLLLILFIIRLFRKRTSLSRIIVGFFTCTALIALLFLIYTLNCGINYHNTSFSEKIGLKTFAYTVQDLRMICRKLTAQINDSGLLVERDSDGLCMLPASFQKDGIKVMQRLSETYPELSGYYPQPKALANSRILSVQNLTGIYSPFTIEANFNGEMPSYNVPFTICHEMSHLRGFMQEQEANFISYLACTSSGIPEYEYSGSLIAWVYCTNVLFRIDPDAYWALRDSLIPEARLDLNANNSFWKQFNMTKVSKTAKKVNDSYLKANGQSDGVQSYNKMVDLIIAYEYGYH